MVEGGGKGRRGQVISADCSEEGWDGMRWEIGVGLVVFGLGVFIGSEGGGRSMMG